MVNNQEEDVKPLSNKAYIQKSDDIFEENKLWIKLKIPKKEEKEDDDMKNYSENTKRVCSFCHKAFSSCKALGGHIRIHVQKSHTKDLENFNKKVLKVHHPIKFKKNKSSCIICGKNFPSMKSLFGHMRCHPDRLWRGIKPPPSMVKKKAVVDLTESLTGWPVTARRGSGARSEDDQLREAVNFLMIMARDKNSQTNEEKGSNEVEKSVAGNGESVNKSDGQGEYSSDDDDDDDQMMKKIRKKVKLCDLRIGEKSISNPVFNSPDKYKCNTCDKSFTTGQALGGHMSSHNKVTLIIPNPGEGRHTGRRMLAFDLNEAPPTSTDENGFDSGFLLGNYGYA